jgi:hypothetical protein
MTAPGAKLYVLETGGESGFSNSGGSVFASNAAASSIISSNKGGDLFRAYGDVSGTVEKVRITNAGNVGIGTTNPLANLQVGNSSNLTNYQGAPVGIILPTGSGSWLELAENSINGTSFRISKDSSTGILLNSNVRDIGFGTTYDTTVAGSAQLVSHRA